MRVLLVTLRFPWPPQQGDRKRARQMIEALSPHHQVTVLAPAAPDEAEARAGEGLKEVRFAAYRPAGAISRGGSVLAGVLRGRPAQVSLHRHRALRRELRRLAPQHDLVIVQLSRLAGHLPDLGDTPVLVDFIDSLSLNAARRGRFDHFWWRPLLGWESWRLRVWEGRLLDHCRAALVVCERDRAVIAAAGAASTAASTATGAASRLHVVPIAQEVVVHDDPSAAEEGVPTLVFTGNLGYFPNRDAAAWLLRNVWPRLRARRPEVRLRIAGARPGWQLRRLASKAGVSLEADPRDLKAVIAGATVALAPLRAGSGLPIKVLEAWSMGVPLIASPWAVAGSTAKADEELLVAGGAAQWVAAIERLLDEPQTRRRLIAAGRRRLEVDYSPKLVNAGFLEAVEVAAGRSTGCSTRG